MSIFGAQTNSQQNHKLLGYRTQTSQRGSVIPVVIGTNRVSGIVIWTGNFSAQAISSGGKSGGKAGKNGGGQYDYKVDLVIALCAGPIGGIVKIWQDRIMYAVGSSSETFTIPTGGGTYDPSQANFYMADNGVGARMSYSHTANDYGGPGSVTLAGTQRKPMSLVTGTPATGQYSLDLTTGTYTFSSADAGIVVEIDYSFYITPGQLPPGIAGTAGNPANNLNLSVFLGNVGQSAWSHLTTNYAQQALGYSRTAYICNQQMDLGSAGTISNFNAEVTGLGVFGNGVLDALPSFATGYFLYDHADGVGFLPSRIGDMTAMDDWCLANSMFYSPVLDSQRQAKDWLTDALMVANTAPVWSDGVLKFVPYGDTSAVGNGAIYTPSTTPIYDIQPQHLLTELNITQTGRRDCYNSVSVQWTNRGNDYNDEPLPPLRDSWSVQKFGLRDPGPISIQGVCDPQVASKLASLALKRYTYIVNTYTFDLSYAFILLEPMDLITLPLYTLMGPGYTDYTPVRITAVEESESGALTITAEDFPWGTATPTLHPTQPAGPALPGYFNAPGDVNPPVFFEAPKEMTQNAGYVLLIVLSGSAAFGGANIWLSRDGGNSYGESPVGQVLGPSPTGYLTAPLPSHPDPDTTDTMSVDLSESNGALPTYAQSDADNSISLCLVDEELICYDVPTLTASNRYTTSAYLRRGVFGTTVAPHLNGARFAGLFASPYQFTYQVGDIGTTLWFKFTAFNTFGQQEQNLADVTAYPFYVTGNASRLPYGPNGGYETPVNGDPLFKQANFILTPTTISEADGVQSGALVQPLVPISSPSTIISSPVLSPTVSVLSTGGSIVGPATAYLAFAGTDSGGGMTSLSNVVAVPIPSGTTASVVLTLESWDASTVKLFLYYGQVSAQQLSYLNQYTPPTLPAVTVTITSLTPANSVTYPIPDSVFNNFLAQEIQVLMPGLWWGPLDSFSHTTGTNTFTFVGTSFPTFTGRALSRFPSSGDIPITDWAITGNTSTTITTVRPSGSGNANSGDMMVVRTIPNIFTGITIGDSALSMTVNQYQNKTVRVLYLDGSTQTSWIVSNTATTFTMQTAFNRGTPLTFWVEDSSYGSPVTDTPSDVSALANGGSGLFVPTPNITGFFGILVQASDAGGNLSLPDFSPFRYFYQVGTPGASGAVVVSVSTTATISAGVNLVNVDGTSAPYTITIPDPSALPATGLTLTRVENPSNTTGVTIVASTGAILDATSGSTSILLDNITYSSVTIAAQ